MNRSHWAVVCKPSPMALDLVGWYFVEGICAGIHNCYNFPAKPLSMTYSAHLCAPQKSWGSVSPDPSPEAFLSSPFWTEPLVSARSAQLRRSPRDLLTPFCGSAAPPVHAGSLGAL